jgi:hypothetical protein
MIQAINEGGMSICRGSDDWMRGTGTFFNLSSNGWRKRRRHPARHCSGTGRSPGNTCRCWYLSTPPSQWERLYIPYCIQGRKMIVFTEYKGTLDYLQAGLEECGYVGCIAILHGYLNRQGQVAAERLFHLPENCLQMPIDMMAAKCL